MALNLSSLPKLIYPRGKSSRHQLHERLSWPQNRCERFEKQDIYILRCYSSLAVRFIIIIVVIIIIKVNSELVRNSINEFVVYQLVS